MIGGIDTVMAPLGGGRLSIIGQGNQLDYPLYMRIEEIQKYTAALLL